MGSLRHCGFSLQGTSTQLCQSSRPKPSQRKERGSPCHPEQRPSPGCSAPVGTAGARQGAPRALTDVRVAEGVLGVAGRACARLGAPVAQAPAAQEHDEPEPGSHCRWGCCSPLQSCRERRRRACCSSSSPARPSGATLGSGALPSECPEGREGARGGCWALAHDSAGWRTLRAKEWELEQEVSRPSARRLPALRRCPAAE